MRSGGIYTHAFVSAVAGSLSYKKDQAFDSSVTIKHEGTPLTPTGASYSGTTGICQITSNNHGLIDGDYVKLRDGALTFTCAEDSNATNHPYPRHTDLASNKWLKVTNVTTNTFDIQVLFSIPSTNQTAHLFVSGLTDGIVKKDDTITVNVGATTAGNYEHKFLYAEPAAIKTGGNYNHVFKSALPYSITKSKDPSYSNVLTIDGATSTSITVNVLPAVPSTNETSHTFISASNNAITTGGQYVHKFIEAQPDGIELESGSITVNVGTTPAVFYSVADAIYDGETGDMELMVGAHELLEGTSIKIHDNALTFTCDMDDHASEHVYPRLTDPAANTALVMKEAGSTSHTVTDASYNTITGDMTCTLNGHGLKTTRTLSPTFAKFDPTTGDMEIYSVNHGITDGESVKLADGAVTFRCAKDQFSSTHPYPRSSDPASDQFLVVKHASQNRFTVNVGTGETGGAISDQSEHRFQASVPNSITVAPNMVKFDQDAITFTCTKDSNATNHAYPRADDPVAGHWIPIKAVTTNTFTVNVGVSTAAGNYPHTFVSATTGGMKLQTGWVKVNVGSTPSTGFDPATASFNAITGIMTLGLGNHYFNRFDNIRVQPESLIFTCGLDNNATNHPYPRSTLIESTPSDVDYNPSTGYLTITQNNHGFSNGDFVRFKENAFTFTCDMNGNADNHSYPRTTDPVYNKWVTVESVQANTFNVFVGKTPTTGFEPYAVDYNPSTGLMKMTIGEHKFTTSQSIRIAAMSLNFRCDQDGQATDHLYPRSTDPLYQTSVPISAVDDTSITCLLYTSPSPRD